MKLVNPGTHPEHAPDGLLHRIIVTAALVVGAVILMAVAVYAAAFLMLAPMMQ